MKHFPKQSRLEQARPNLLLRTLGLKRPNFVVGDPLPLAWHWMHFCPSAFSADLMEDGRGTKGDIAPHLDGYRRMWAGGRFRVDRLLRLGEVISCRKRLLAVRETVGRSGKLILADIEHRFFARSEFCLEEIQCLVFREADGNLAGVPGVRHDRRPIWVKEVTPDEVMLFRYSALTFNAHRIHYDWPYTTGVERYPGLVVHGPLICTLLLELVHDNRPDATPTDVSYRAMRPAFANCPIRLCGTSDSPNSAEVWAEDGEGHVLMNARVNLSRTPQ